MAVLTRLITYLNSSEISRIIPHRPRSSLQAHFSKLKSMVETFSDEDVRRPI